MVVGKCRQRERLWSAVETSTASELRNLDRLALVTGQRAAVPWGTAWDCRPLRRMQFLTDRSTQLTESEGEPSAR